MERTRMLLSARMFDYLVWEVDEIGHFNVRLCSQDERKQLVDDVVMTEANSNVQRSLSSLRRQKTYLVSVVCDQSIDLSIG